MAKVRIEITQNFVEVRELGESFVIGRGEDADLILLHQSVSRRHARIAAIKDGGFQVEDLGSSNGVLVNNEKVEKQKTRRLVTGDILQIGVHRLFFSLQDFGIPGKETNLLDITDDAKEELLRDLAAHGDLVVRFRSNEASVEVIQAAINQRFESLGFDDLERINLETAVNEAVGNAVRHGHKYDESKIVELRLIVDDTKLVLQVKDQGPGFDFKAALRKGMELDAVDAARARFQEGGLGGLGILMMLRCVDNVEYNEAGNHLTLTKYRTADARAKNQPPPNPGSAGTIVGT